jgi:predicted nucleic acid-binding protein
MLKFLAALASLKIRYSNPSRLFSPRPLPYNAAFLAEKSFLEYRRRGGEWRSPLPDFYIGAHSAVVEILLLTRDANRYRTYFPSVQLITP